MKNNKAYDKNISEFFGGTSCDVCGRPTRSALHYYKLWRCCGEKCHNVVKNLYIYESKKQTSKKSTLL